MIKPFIIKTKINILHSTDHLRWSFKKIPVKIYLDFDGTIVEHLYPEIGKYNSGCKEVIYKLEKAGHEIILNTYRADCANGTLEEAVSYIKSNKIVSHLTHIETRKIAPTPWNWDFFKYSNLIFIDDICKGTPLKNTLTSITPVVDWKKLDTEFLNQKLY